MFTGIIETLGKITQLTPKKNNLHITIASDFSAALKIDQSVALNGVCLTVVAVENQTYTTVAIAETLAKTNLRFLRIGSPVNLERAMLLGDRIDGHIVQGHVDQTATCTKIENCEGSWQFTFTYENSFGHTTIEKGSITIDGTSLTVINRTKNSFSVAIIPYTYKNTIFNTYKVGTVVNLEFDIIGKYVARLMEQNT